MKKWTVMIAVIACLGLIVGSVGLIRNFTTTDNSIATLTEQIENINNSLPQLGTTDTELKNYIATLEQTAQQLQTKLTETNAKLDEVESEIYGKVDSEKSETLAQLTAAKAELEEKIAAANKAIEDAKTANSASEKAITDQIAALEAELEKADADNKKALEDSIAALETALTTADANNKKALEDSIAALKTQVESGDATLTTAIQTLNTNLSALIKTNADNIAVLQTTATGLQTQIDAINTDISGLKTELETKITESEQKVLGELNTLKTSIEGQIATINTDIAALKAKDTELAGKIEDLKAYVDAQDTANKTWANATFATLEQYSKVQTEIAGIKESISTINADIEAIQKDIADQVKTINNSITDLDTKLGTKVTEITNGYTSAVANAKSEITAAYTSAIASAIENSEITMKAWVNKTLQDGYYTITEVDAKLSALDTKLTTADNAMKDELKTQKTALETAKTELTTAYEKAIENAIDNYNGTITKKIADDIAAAKTDLQGKIDAINAEITAIKNRLDVIESDVAALLAQIQSVNYIPMYDDGKVKVAADASGNKYAFFDFMVSPKSVLANVDEATLMQYLSMQAIYTKRAETRGDEQSAVSFIDMEILDVAYNATTGVLTVKASGDNLSADFYNANVYASAFLTITTGKTEIISDYIPMVAHSSVWVNVVTVEDWINVTVNGGTAEEVIN